MQRLTPFVFLLAFVGCGQAGHESISRLRPPTNPTQPVQSSRIRERGQEAAPIRPSEPAAPIVDSNLTLDQALDGSDGPEDVRGKQALIDVRYYSFDRRLHQGQILVNRDLASDVKAIFEEIEKSRFPIAKCVPICKYDWSDEASVADDNTSGFNYRDIPATHHLSQHATGRAIDLNPWQNPYDDPINGTTQVYDPSVPGTLSRNSPPTLAFRKHGWSWGGVWRRGRDYQHFEKR